MSSDIAKVLTLVPNNSQNSIEELCNPKEKQKVPLATELLVQFCEAVQDVDKLKTLSFRIADVAEELHLLKYVIEGILATYTDAKMSIQEQLEKISFAAHILLVLQRDLRSFLPNQL